MGLATALLWTESAVGAQEFGRNKVEYRDFDFRILHTEHFAIYYYPPEEPAVRHAARLAERWYARLSKLFGHTLGSRQPLILYGSHPEFAQTNVISQFLDESIGGVTDSLRRRVAMPFAPGLGETDHVLGHEIVHAFQMDLLKRQKRPFRMPLWFAEGMAEYLTLGPADAQTAAWIRDAVARDALPSLDRLEARAVSAYRFGHALWAYVAGRFGDGIVQQVFGADGQGGALARLATATGVEISVLSADWHAAIRQTSGPILGRAPGRIGRSFSHGSRGRLALGPSLSPNGRELVFLSEKDQLSVDVFLADAATGAIKRKLLTRADPQLESLQFVKSSGAWDSTGRRFVMSVVRRGAPVLVFIDVGSGARERELSLPQFGEIFTPTWSPDGTAVAFAALKGGLTDLHAYDLARGRLTPLTDDAFTDLQPAWSPDGRHLAFVTDRFSSDLTLLRFGTYHVALLDLETREIRRVPGFDRAKNIDPQWGPDGACLFFLSDPFGISNVFRIDLKTSALTQITDVSTGVMGLTSSSPALSVAHSGSKLAFSVFRDGRYQIDIIEDAPALAGAIPVQPAFVSAALLPPHDRKEFTVPELLLDPAFGLPPEPRQPAAEYVADLSLEALGQPYLSSGGSRFGSFVRGGMSFFFGDVLGEQKLGAALQVGSRVEDFAAQVRFLNRESRWNWGGTASILPYVRTGSRNLPAPASGAATIRQIERLRQTHSRVAGLLAYPFSPTQRVELGAGLRHVASARELPSRAFLSRNRRSSGPEQREVLGIESVTQADASVALVYDSALWGPASPILGTRSRIEVNPSIGGMPFTSVLVDYRRYLMLIRPFTIAARLRYSGRYGTGGNDPRLRPLFLGDPHLVRGYGLASLDDGCSSTIVGECANVDRLIGTRLLVGNLELRFPLRGLRSRSSTYGRFAAEGVLFADAGGSWGGPWALSVRAQHLVRSAGAAVRLAPLGYVVQIGAVRIFDHPTRRWSLLLDFRPGF